MITATQLDTVYFRIDVEDNSIKYEIRDYFTYYDDNYKFSPQYKAGVWDGKRTLFNRDQKLYYGLIGKLKEFCEENNYSLEIKYLDKEDTLSLNELNEFIDTLNLESNHEKIVPYDYQLNAVKEAINRKRMTLVSPTSSGKSLMIYIYMRYLLSKSIKVLIIVPSISLIKQLAADFIDYSSNDKSFSEDTIQTISSGKSKAVFRNVVISTWQSLTSVDKDWLNQFGCIINDETHDAKAKVMRSILEQTTEVTYKLGTTGTLSYVPSHDLIVTGLFGDRYITKTTKELIDAGQAAELSIECLVLKYSDKTLAKKCRKFDYSQELEFIGSYKKRNELISKLALKCNGNVLILFERISQGKELYDIISNYDRPVYFIDGSVSGEDRESIRTQVNKSNNAIVIASYKTTSTGVSIKNLNYVIAATPTKSMYRLIQSIGRGLRLAKGKTKVTWFDISDTIWTAGQRCNIGQKHFIERCKIYRSEKHQYNVREVNF